MIEIDVVLVYRYDHLDDWVDEKQFRRVLVGYLMFVFWDV